MELLIAPKKARWRPNSYVRHWFLCLHVDGVVLTAPDAKLNTGKIFFEKNANLSTRQINQLHSMRSVTVSHEKPRKHLCLRERFRRPENNAGFPLPTFFLLNRIRSQFKIFDGNQDILDGFQNKFFASLCSKGKKPQQWKG